MISRHVVFIDTENAPLHGESLFRILSVTLDALSSHEPDYDPGKDILFFANDRIADIRALVQEAQKAVKEKFGFSLEPEIIFI